MYKSGQEVEAVILSIDEEHKKVALGIKQLSLDPWKSIEKEMPVGSRVSGTITKIGNYGAFVKLANKVEGLIYNSELEQSKDNPVEVGQTRELRVININAGERKIGLSLKLEDTGKEDHAAQQFQAERPKKKVARTVESDQKEVEQSKAAAAPKMKSALQIELERHAARQQDGEAVENQDSQSKKKKAKK